MKKLFFAIGIVLLAISCSSDEEPYFSDYFPDQGLKHIKIDVRESASFISDWIAENGNPAYLGGRNHGDPENDINYLIYYSYKKGYRVYDYWCPHEWRFQDIKGTILHDSENPGTAFCTSCKSRFNLNTAESISGPAKENGLRLVEYQVRYIQDKDEYHITNPNYKGE